MSGYAARKLELTPLLIHKALEAAPDPMTVIDASGIIQYSNPRTREVFGYFRQGIAGSDH